MKRGPEEDGHDASHDHGAAVTKKQGTELGLFCIAPPRIEAPQIAERRSISVEVTASAASQERIWSSQVRVSLFATPTGQHKSVVQAAVEEWNSVMPVLIIGEDNDQSAEIRVGFTPGNGHWSFIGKDAKTVASHTMTMNLDPGGDGRASFGRAEALHELGHALGLTHEHQHPRHCIVWKEAAVYEALGRPPNSWLRDQVDAQILRAEPRATTSLGYDTMSIMHYTFQRDWIHKKSTLKKLTGVFGAQAEERYNELFIPAADLSALDQSLIKTLYKGLRPQ